MALAVRVGRVALNVNFGLCANFTEALHLTRCQRFVSMLREHRNGNFQAYILCDIPILIQKSPVLSRALPRDIIVRTALPDRQGQKVVLA